MIWNLFRITHRIVPVTNKPPITCQLDHRLVALTSIIMKCFKGLVWTNICSTPSEPTWMRCTYLFPRLGSWVLTLPFVAGSWITLRADPQWWPHLLQADSAVKVSQKHCFFKKRLKKIGMFVKNVPYLYRCTIESIPGCLNAWCGLTLEGGGDSRTHH